MGNKRTQNGREPQKENKKEKKKFPLLYGIDWTLVLIVAVLLIFGLIMLYSASSFNAQSEHNDSLYFVRKQLFAIVVGLVLMFVVVIIPHGFWKKISPFAYGAGCLMMLAILTPLGMESHGAKRWLDFKVITVQPSEILKIALILCTAYLICKYIKTIKNFKTYLKVLIPVAFAAGLVIIVTDDLGTGIIVFVTGMVMILLASPRRIHVLATAVLIIIVGVLFSVLEPYRLDRVRAWLDLESYADDIGYQVIQGLYAIGSGGLVGKGLGKSTQKLGFVPESQNDLIFSIICEELGVIGGIILVLLFVLLIWRFKKIYDASNDMYGKIVVAGVSAHIASQTFINMAVVTSLIPNTGVPLPFISYGGTAMMFLLAEIGLVLSVARETERNKLESIEFVPKKRGAAHAGKKSAVKTH